MRTPGFDLYDHCPPDLLPLLPSAWPRSRQGSLPKSGKRSVVYLRQTCIERLIKATWAERAGEVEDATEGSVRALFRSGCFPAGRELGMRTPDVRGATDS